ncbi:MAG: hypothetical protein ABH883_01080, partial [Candidatus Omnitrophota bacterium]
MTRISVKTLIVLSFLVFFSAVSFCGALELVGKEGVLYSGENTDWKAFLEGELRLAYDSTAR